MSGEGHGPSLVYDAMGTRYHYFVDLPSKTALLSW